MSATPPGVRLLSATLTLHASGGGKLHPRRIALYGEKSIESTCYAATTPEPAATGHARFPLELTGDAPTHAQIDAAWLYLESNVVVGRTDLELHLTWSEGPSTTPLAVVDGAGYSAPQAYWFRLSELALHASA